MAMPEAAVNKDYGFVFGQNDVGTAGQYAVVQPEAVAQFVQDGAHNEFRFGVLAANPAHVPASALSAQMIASAQSHAQIKS